MHDHLPTYDVAIVGGGVIGLAIAWLAARQGMGAAVVDPSPGAGASRVAAGMLAPVTEVHYGEEPLLRLNLRAAERYPSFVAEVEEAAGVLVGYRRCGMLAVAFDAGDRAVLDDLRDFQLRLGLDVDRLSGRECRRLEPFLAPSVQVGLVVSGDHQVDPRRLTRALQVAAERAGVAMIKASVSRLSATHQGSASGVVLDDGTAVAAGTVVLAAGAHSGQIGGVPEEIRPPVRPVKGQVIRLQMAHTTAPLLSRSVRGTVRGAPVYLVPRVDGELVIGATQEEQGFDEQVTAGGVYELLRDARSIVPGITELPLAEASAGLRPGTPDSAPLVGGTAMPGLVVAAGHHRNGILLAPVTADAVVAILSGEPPPAYIEPFGPQRFSGREVLT